MGYERYPRGTNPQGDYYGRQDQQDYGRDYGSGRDYGYSSARDYRAAGELDDRDQGSQRGYGRDRDQGGYGQREYGNAGYGQRSRGGYGQQRSDRGQGEYHGSYGSDGRRFEDVGARRGWDDDNRRDPDARYGQNRDQGQRQQGYGRAPQGYDYQDRGFFSRAGDEVRSWFGDEDAERRREADMRYDERSYGGSRDRDDDYHGWRSGQIAAFDRDYDEYRRENRSKFESEFSTWRTARQGQRDSLNQAKEHMDVVGSDGEHVGTVDKVRGDRILLTKNDADAGGRHHSIPSRWIQTVDTKVTLSKTAAEAKQQWQDEERNQALFGYGDRDGDRSDDDDGGANTRGRNLNRSFSGTY